MSSKAIIVIIGLVIVVAGVGLWVVSSWPSQEAAYEPTPQPLTSNENNNPAEPANLPDLSLPAATGNIDDVVSSILEEANSENTILDQEDSQAGQVTADSQAIGDIGQSSDDTQGL